MNRGSALALSIVLAGALSGCSILGGGNRTPDPGTHISGAEYTAQLVAWCAPQKRRLTRLGDAVTRAVASHDRPAFVRTGSALIRWYIAYDSHFEATPVPAGMKARMTPVLERMADADPTWQSVLAGLKTLNGPDVLVGMRAVDKLFKKIGTALRLAGLAACS